MIEFPLKAYIQVDAAVIQGRSTVNFILKTFEWLTLFIFLPAYAALVSPLLGYCAHESHALHCMFCKLRKGKSCCN